jgi:alkylhydroperoxidase family enzyme
MARIEPLSLEEVDPKLKHLCDYAEAQTGTSASPRTYAKNPSVMLALAGFRAALEKDTQLDPVLKELVRLKVAALNACRY